jgi:hypothetical protein
MMDKPVDITMPLHRRALYGLTNWGLFVAGMVNLVVGSVSAVHEHASIAATSLTAGLVLLFAATIDRFESLKGLGVEAKTRRLDQKIEQADDALRRLRDLTELTGTALVDLHSKMGRWDSAPSAREAYGLAQKVRSIMEGLGSVPRAVAIALRPWATTLCRDLMRTLVAPLEKAMTDQMRQFEQQRASIKQPIDPTNPDFVRLNAQVNEASQYLVDKLRKPMRLQLDDFPACLVRAFDDVPFLAAEIVNPIQENALRFTADMEILRETASLAHAEAWFSELELEKHT